jgi:diacylglycerol kinase family enzyme
MFNIGFDCNVVDMTDTVKKLPFISGSLAYLISVFIILIRKKGANLKIFYPNGKVRFGKILLIAIANGCYCGGGVKGVPYAVTDDGIMDVSIIKDISRILFIRLFPSYSKGIHMEQTRISTERFVEYSTEDKLSIEAIDPAGFRLCTDGEITTQHKVDMEVVKGGFNFIIPAQDK